MALVSKSPAQYVFAQNSRVVTIHDNGQTYTLASGAKTVGQVLNRLPQPLGNQDKTEPSLNTELRGDDFTINVYRARPIVVVDGANRYNLLTAERSPQAIAEAAGFATNQEDQFRFQRADDPTLGAPGTQMVIERSKVITFELYGTSSSVNTHQSTVAGFLAERKLTLEPGDEINLPSQTRIIDGLLISLARVGRNVETVEEPVAFSEEQIKDAQQPTSYKKIQTPGKNGKKLVTYELVSRNGGPAVKTSIKEVITEQPTKQVAVVGAKSNTFSGDFGAALAKLRSCEGAYTSNTGNGYYGAYQFNLGTWRSNAPAGYKDTLPSNAPPGVQDEAAANLYKARGWQPWPSCSRKLGLQDIYR